MIQKRTALLRQQGYSEKAIDLLRESVNLGTLSPSTIKSTAQSDCGDILILYLNIHGEKITEVRFQYIGCAGLQAAASGLSLMLTGATLREALKITSEALIGFLGGLPGEKLDCVDFCIETCRKTLSRYLQENVVPG